MSPPEKPKGPSKPFLGETELSSELDAWDEMFDGLHGGPDAAAADEQAMSWPAPAESRVPEPALTKKELSHTLEDEPDLDAELTLDRIGPDELPPVPPVRRSSP